ncbi:hypothetical protein [Mycolicibacterium fortuitum]|uniref:hypothetical protein n=1 Tax=Mycolicibacterium fortuitum TaxID=1766 RepID=UPI00241EF39E|nr:hypothetical protein [Mycolicibacterium fortuitum]MDG5779708.1 hypothetical protein [Mycolicibacterium fortuitum]
MADFIGDFVSAASDLAHELRCEAQRLYDRADDENSRLNAELKELRSQVRVLTQGGAA